LNDFIPTGTYSVNLVYYGPNSGPLTDCVVKVINGLGITETFPVTLGYFDLNKVHVTNFTVGSNNNIEF